MLNNTRLLVINPDSANAHFIVSPILSFSYTRYGDMLNPWGDLIAMARSWCLVKPGGYGVVGVPTGPGVDVIKLPFFFVIDFPGNMLECFLHDETFQPSLMFLGTTRDKLLSG
jgi:hypothetical protein